MVKGLDVRLDVSQELPKEESVQSFTPYEKSTLQALSTQAVIDHKNTGQTLAVTQAFDVHGDDIIPNACR